MSEENEGQERSHEATARKLDQAREKGDIAQSQDAQTAIAYAGFAGAAAIGLGWSTQHLGETLKALLDRPGDLAKQAMSGGGGDLVAALFWRVGESILPLMLIPGLLVLGFLTALRRVVIAPGKIAPKLSRVSVVQNARQKFGPQGLVEFLKSGLKLAAVIVVLCLALDGELDRIAGYAAVEARLMGGLLEAQFWSVMWGALLVAILVGLVDFFWQRHRHLGRLRMTLEELKQEAKETEGDPHMRSSRRERAREIATNRMLLDVPKADVVITNPTHYAVALGWDRAGGGAPRCLAKGVDEVAAAIRRRAVEAGVPLRSDPPTARALHASMEIGDEIPYAHFRAVAAAIVFADEMRRRRRKYGPDFGWQSQDPVAGADKARDGH